MGDQTAGCVLFADVSGSTKLYEIVGDTQAHAAVDLCVKLFSALTEQHGGRVVKTIGDEVMAVFADAPPAAQRDLWAVTKHGLEFPVGISVSPIDKPAKPFEAGARSSVEPRMTSRNTPVKMISVSATASSE